MAYSVTRGCVSDFDWLLPPFRTWCLTSWETARVSEFPSTTLSSLVIVNRNIIRAFVMFSFELVNRDKKSTARAFTACQSWHALTHWTHHRHSIQEVPGTKDVISLGSFMGLVGYYVKCILNSAKLVEPILRLLRETTSFFWDEAAEQSFRQRKSRLTSNNLLHMFHASLTFIVRADASSFGTGAVLKQVDGEDAALLSGGFRCMVEGGFSCFVTFFVTWCMSFEVQIINSASRWACSPWLTRIIALSKVKLEPSNTQRS